MVSDPGRFHRNFVCWILRTRLVSRCVSRSERVVFRRLDEHAAWHPGRDARACFCFWCVFSTLAVSFGTYLCSPGCCCVFLQGCHEIVVQWVDKRPPSFATPLDLFRCLHPSSCYLPFHPHSPTPAF